MSDYIRRDIVIANVIEQMRHGGEYSMRERLLNLKAADVAPVVRGRWMVQQFPNMIGYKCSACYTTWDYGTNFCPNCGADMRGYSDV